MRVPEGHLEVAVGIGVIPEGATGEPQHASGVARRKRNLEAVRSGVGEPLNTIGPEIVVLALLTVANHGRSGRLELRDRVPNRRIVERLECRIRRIGRDRLNQ
jgi:hypothetical protein